jgi:hypothetical protein
MFSVANLPLVSTTLAVNSTTGTLVVDTGGKFATCVNETVDIFAAGVKDASGKCPLYYYE